MISMTSCNSYIKKEEVITNANVPLECLSVCTAFNFVYVRESCPLVTTSCVSNMAGYVLCVSPETGVETYRHEDLIVTPILKFIFERFEERCLWVHNNKSKSANIVTSFLENEEGKLESFTIGCGKIVTVKVPPYAECVLVS